MILHSITHIHLHIPSLFTTASFFNPFIYFYNANILIKIKLILSFLFKKNLLFKEFYYYSFF